MPDLPQDPDNSFNNRPQSSPQSVASAIPLSTDPPSDNPSSNHSNQPMTPIKDPLTSSIIHDTNDKVLVETMTWLACAGADAGAAAAAAAAAPESSTISSPDLSSTTSSSTTSTPLVPSSVTDRSQQPMLISRPTPVRPIIDIPLPSSPITLHHALDGPIPHTPVAKDKKGLPRSNEACVRDTLAKDSPNSGDRNPYTGAGSFGQRRIMTPTSRLAETAVGVREVSKKIGRARVKWETPKTVMIVTKPGDDSLLKITKQIALWMISTREIIVYVDEKMKDIPKFKYPSFLRSTKLGYDYTQSLKFWTSDLCAQDAHIFDFVITLGGDGTVLYTSWLFQQIVPPILPFSAGSLGFLTPFPTGDYQHILNTCLDHGVRVNLRIRFSCTIYRCLEHRTVKTTKKKKRKGQRNRIKGEKPSIDSDSGDNSDRREALPTVLTTPTETFEILNDLVLDRGPSANLSLLELFGDDQHLTTVQADGIVISTPTGSTAYSLAAGGPLTHPEIPAILISPICPHTLSFRPMLLPDSMELRICVPFDSRSTAWASFDGRNRVELKQGDHIKVTSSVYPLPTICSSTQSSDWFHSLSRCLRWNERERQKGFTVVEHSRPKRARQPSSLSPSGSKSTGLSGEGAQSSVTGGNTSGGNASASQSTQDSQNPDNSSGSSTSRHPSQGHNLGRSQSQNQLSSLGQHNLPDSHHASGNSSANSSRAKTNLKSSPGSPAARKRSNASNDYFDQSPQDTDTMLTCWGTDSSDTDNDDDSNDDDDSDDDGDDEEDGDGHRDDKNDASDGDGEWEEGASSDSDYDDDDVVRAVNIQSGSKGSDSERTHEITPKIAAEIVEIPSTTAVTNKMSQVLLEPGSNAKS
ncbi:hypothetical protein BGZ46_004304 [Entomortierella lignicola]|nr:hypothetical protein BGZ46_004304 [Entomortierella lignicola]